MLTTMLATITAPIVITITPNTLQPLPFTSSRLRPNDSPADLPSSTIVGTISDQIVRRKSPGNDQEDEAERDAEAGEDPGDDQGRQARLHAAEQLADREVLLAVAHVLDGLDERPLEPEGADDAGEPSDDRPEPAEKQREHERDQAENDVDDQRERDEGAPVALVELPRFANDCPGLH